ncbi:N-acetylmuramoyl-L-alanine amidase family protein [Paenibacillus aquistagni]|uniref:N-acetylmuramoyl-L-alanine amidase n=1 Tax=Paenibacillus aquistagni TaxID=1852522 RepID=A0A1X7JED8_9BACL|nr:N-acetylmuramoyl-L-alanine amidase family protein [Paenibacillus aquistagni]SMG25982.1 N-acetylmuramoyl-L-alanine amidase [Paenibacillus aquistagni]
MQQKTKRWLTGLMFMFLLAIVFPQVGQAAPQPSLYLDGSSIKTPEPITLKNNFVMVPIRVVSETLGYKVDWEKNTRMVVIYGDNKRIELKIDSKTATINSKEVKLDQPAYISGGSTLVPLRFVGESMGLTVDWDNSSKSVYLFTPDDGSTVEPTPPGTGGTGEGNGTGSETPNASLTKVQDFVFGENTLHISLEKDVEPKISMMTAPDRVIIDLPKTTFSQEFLEKYGMTNGGQGTQLITGYPDVQQVRFAQFEKETVRFVIDASYALDVKTTKNGSGLLSFEVSTKSSGGGTTIPPTKPDGKYTVVLDAGHGAHDSGAVSVKKRTEKDFNLQQTLKIAELMRKDDRFHVVLTREDDTFLELSDRVKIANDLNADLFVSIHGNSADSAAANGTETYWYRPESKAFADVMHKYLLQGTQLKDRGVRQGNLHVIRNTKMPGILLEIGFLSNTSDEAKMFDEQFQQRVAEQVFNGIKAYLGLS